MFNLYDRVIDLYNDRRVGSVVKANHQVITVSWYNDDYEELHPANAEKILRKVDTSCQTNPSTVPSSPIHTVPKMRIGRTSFPSLSMMEPS